MATAAAEDNGFATTHTHVEPLASHNGLERCVCVTITNDIEKIFRSAVYSGPREVRASTVACTSPGLSEHATIVLNPGGNGNSATGSSKIMIHNGVPMSKAIIDFTVKANWNRPTSSGVCPTRSSVDHTNTTTASNRS